MGIVEATRDMLGSGPVCDACLGRVFADRSHGLTNEERGRSLRITRSMTDDEPIAWATECWVCEGLCETHDVWAARAAAAVDTVEFETYQVGTKVPPLIEENDRLLREHGNLPEDAGESFKSAFNREVGKRLGRRTGTTVDFERPDVVVVLNLRRGDVDLQINPAFIYGRYRKHQRGVPQTEWPCRECGGSGKQLEDGDEIDCGNCGGTGYLYETSVEEELAPHVLELTGGAAVVFHGAGREDVDARMVGTGRPFVIEVKEPRRRSPDLTALQEAVNQSPVISVDSLKLVRHGMVERVKELAARKEYRTAIEFSDSVDSQRFTDALSTIHGATIAQRTPSRVDHRRADKTRKRVVYAAEGCLVSREEMSAESLPIDPTDDLPQAAAPSVATQAIVDFETQGGTYVKELVSGDAGRTEPSLAGLLGVSARVVCLDVLTVEGEDEQFVIPDYRKTGEE